MHSYKSLQHYVDARVSTTPHSRLHSLKTIGNARLPCFVKRDDELGFGVSGTKYRKYVSLIPYVLEKGYQHAAVIGSAHSNNVLSIVQLLIENNIRPTLFLKQMHATTTVGNYLLTSLFVNPSQIHWLNEEEWPQAETIAATLPQTFIIKEGACQPEALAGAMTLAMDLISSRQHDNIQHIFIDAGTGLSAIATILAFSYLSLDIRVHVLLLADNEEAFYSKLRTFASLFAADIGWHYEWQQLIARIFLYRPTSSKSFGATTPGHFKKIKEIARYEGFLTDPIYSVKLFMAMERIVLEKKLIGRCLIVHSGGGLALMGFQAQLNTALIS